MKECDRTGKTAMHYCAENTVPDVAQLLTKANAELVNQADEEGYTPLHLAVIAGNRIMIRYLLDHGAEVNLLDNERHSVIHWATVCGELEALDVILDAGAEASVEDIHGAYPIHYAAQMCGNSKNKGPAQSTSRYAGLAALKKLINHGVPVDVIDRDGRQPLLWAASSGILYILHYIIHYILYIILLYIFLFINSIILISHRSILFRIYIYLYGSTLALGLWIYGRIILYKGML